MMTRGRDFPKGGLARNVSKSGAVRMRGRCHAARVGTIKMSGGRSCSMAGAVRWTGAPSLSRARAVRRSGLLPVRNKAGRRPWGVPTAGRRACSPVARLPAIRHRGRRGSPAIVWAAFLGLRVRGLGELVE
eukprot:12311202-Alexandrium_andersonii.AAC.1